MPNDRDKLLKVMDSLEEDYASGKISPEKYSYFRSKYEDKLNSIDAREATRRIRSMQGKPSSSPNKEKRRKRPTKNKKEKEDLVQKYIINPKKDDAKYNKKEKKSMDSGTFKLLLLLILVLGFTVGVGYGVFNLDFDNLSETSTVATVQDTAFPDIHEDIVQNTSYTKSYDTSSYNDDSSSSYDNVETTQDSSYSSDYSSSSSDSGYSSDSGSYSDSGSSSDSSGSGSSSSGGNGGGNSEE